MFIESFRVESPHVRYGPMEIESEYRYDTTELVHEGKDGASRWVVRPKSVKYNFRTSTAVPKLGVMLVGWGGNNGSTLTAGVIANREGISWVTKDKVQQANYFGSLTQASTIRVGSYNGEEIYAPFKSLLPMDDDEGRLSKLASILEHALDIYQDFEQRPQSLSLQHCWGKSKKKRKQQDDENKMEEEDNEEELGQCFHWAYMIIKFRGLEQKQNPPEHGQMKRQAANIQRMEMYVRSEPR